LGDSLAHYRKAYRVCLFPYIFSSHTNKVLVGRGNRSKISQEAFLC
jgi:hypothetical protein